MKQIRKKQEQFTMTAEKPRYKLKVVLVGDSFVGKTALIGRFVEDRFNENSKPTCVCTYCHNYNI